MTFDHIDEQIAVASPTVARCHLMGGLLSVAVILCTTWVWSLSQSATATIQVGEELVNHQEAEALINNADQWRSIHDSSLKQSQELDTRCLKLSNWLPESIDWDSTRASLREIIDSAGVELLELNRGAESVGTRVGVVQATCKIEGTYSGICRVLDGIANRDQPIACSEINLHRLPDAVEHEDVLCRATMVLRIPFAAKGSAAHQALLSSNTYTK
ncbi:MAG: hypothetical protein ACR2NZ_20095 [Rubripirellula sp.]